MTGGEPGQPADTDMAAFRRRLALAEEFARVTTQEEAMRAMITGLGEAFRQIRSAADDGDDTAGMNIAIQAASLQLIIDKADMAELQRQYNTTMASEMAERELQWIIDTFSDTTGLEILIKMGLVNALNQGWISEHINEITRRMGPEEQGAALTERIKAFRHRYTPKPPDGGAGPDIGEHPTPS